MTDDERRIAAFTRLINKAGPESRPGLGPCWLYLGRIDKDGYGMHTVPILGERQAHRIAFALARGPIADGVLVCHSCDVRSCVRDDHFFPGDALTNARDCVAKGRSQKGDRHPRRRRAELAEVFPYGARCHAAKLDDDRVRALFSLKGTITQGAAAARFGVSKPVVAGIWRGTMWKHLRLVGGVP